MSKHQIQIEDRSTPAASGYHIITTPAASGFSYPEQQRQHTPAHKHTSHTRRPHKHARHPHTSTGRHPGLGSAQHERTDNADHAAAQEFQQQPQHPLFKKCGGAGAKFVAAPAPTRVAGGAGLVGAFICLVTGAADGWRREFQRRRRRRTGPSVFLI